MKKVVKIFGIMLILLQGFQTVKAQQEITTDTNPIYLDVGNGNSDLGESDIVITWISPDENLTRTNEKTLHVKIGINSGSPITNVRLLVNDHAVTTRGVHETGDKGYSDFDMIYESDIQLADGKNDVMIGVRNEKGGQKVESRKITGPEKNELTMMRTDYALLIATNEYDHFNNLTNPVFDAKTIADELQKNYGFKVDLLVNPTQDEIMIKLKEYSKKTYLPYDQLFIFIAGHGQYDEAFGEGYIVAKNTKLDDAAKTSYISHSVLRNVIDNIPVQHIFLMMDVCFGGTFDPTIAQAGSRGQEDVYQEVSMNSYIQRKLQYKTRQYITSGGKQYVPDGRPGMHSPFARKFIEALRSDGGPDGILKISDIKDFLERTVPEPRAGEFGRNEPGSDFLFIRQHK